MLDLLSLANAAPITNSDVRAVLNVGRRQAWNRLSRLVELGFLEKRRHAYRASPYAKTLVEALAATFGSIMSGRPLQTEHPALSSLLKMAREGLEVLHARGRIEQPEYDEKLRLLEKMEAELDVKGN